MGPLHIPYSPSILKMRGGTEGLWVVASTYNTNVLILSYSSKDSWWLGNVRVWNMDSIYEVSCQANGKSLLHPYECR